ncbi:MAG: MarR family transcriptional regulator [Spirochaetes bacterium]|nr:MarR family transcriptional regulator [Spirochaetota bacterium]
MSDNLKNTSMELQKVFPLFFKHLIRADQKQIETGLNRVHYEILEALEIAGTDNETLTLSVLARRLLISKAYVTALTDKLYREKFIKRVNDRNDRRNTNVFLTDSGRKALSDYQNYSLEIFITRLSELCEDDLNRLHASIKTIREIIVTIKI